MKLSIANLALFCLGMILPACENGFAVNREARIPRILSMTIPGVPDKDIRIDQAASTITVRLPSVVPVGGLVPVFRLSGKAVAKVSDGSWSSDQGKLPISHLATCDWGAPAQPYIGVLDESIRKPYINGNTYLLIYVKPEGCMKAIADQPIGYKLGDNNIHLYLPLKNLYSSPRMNSLHVKNLETGVTASSLLTDGVCTNGNYTEISDGNITKIYNYGDVHFFMKPDFQFVPGRYQVSIGLDCNKTTIVFPQPLVIGK